VKPLAGAFPLFLPGQYVNVTAPTETVKRPYSFTPRRAPMWRPS